MSTKLSLVSSHLSFDPEPPKTNDFSKRLVELQQMSGGIDWEKVDPIARANLMALLSMIGDQIAGAK